MAEESDKFAIHEAAREGRVSVVESLLNANPKLANRKDDDERLPIHWAVSYNHLPIVQLLVQSKGFDPDVQDGMGWTSLMMAVSIKDADALVDLLLSKGADVNRTNEFADFDLDNNGQTALHFAASKNNIDVARKLIAHKATTRKKDKRQQLPLHRAAAIGSVPMLKLYLENQSPVNATDIDGMTALHHAISEGHADAALFLLKSGADPKKEDQEGNLALQLAPDAKVRDFVVQGAEREGIDLQ